MADSISGCDNNIVCHCGDPLHLLFDFYIFLLLHKINPLTTQLICMVAATIRSSSMLKFTVKFVQHCL